MMKCVYTLFLGSVLAFGAEDFQTGQAARALIGQATFTSQDAGASEFLIGGISGLAYANDILIVADANRVGASPINHRVLIYRNISSMVPKPTDVHEYGPRCPVCVGQASQVVGQPDFNKTDYGLSQTQLRTPTAVATDGTKLVVADTDNNRVLIWNSIPTTNGAPADVVVGQPDFNTAKVLNPPTDKSLRGPQGVWIKNGRLYVADTQNHRVLIYRSIPASSGAAADIVLGQPNFTTVVEPDLTQTELNAHANTLLNPVSVTTDGQRLYVTDLGHNRVLIWNSLPETNQAPANVVLGQPDMESAAANNSAKMCAPTGTDDAGAATYAKRCASTLDFPRFAESDGTRLFVADGGSDRILIYNTIPTTNGAGADQVIGQLGGDINQASDAADSMRGPLGLAWDGSNLYVSDSFNRRINIYSPLDIQLRYTAVRNSASREIFAVGTVTLAGKPAADNKVTVKIGEVSYEYKILEKDTLEDVVLALTGLINAGSGDPLVFATANTPSLMIVLTAREAGEPGNKVTFSASVSSDAVISATTSGANLTGGMDAAKIAPGTIVTVLGDNLADTTALAPEGATILPTALGGVRLYFDGMAAPLLFVSPTQINAQIPLEVSDATSVNAYVRTERKDGTVTATTPAAVTVIGQNPGIYAYDGPDPRPGIVLHSSSNATGTISVDGSISPGEIMRVTIQDRTYQYITAAEDSLASVRDGLIALINQDPEVEAYPAGVFTRIRLRARVGGPEGNGIDYTARGLTAEGGEGSQTILTATGAELCCASTAGSPVNDTNPAVPGETIIVYATGLGAMKVMEGVSTGHAFNGVPSEPVEFVSSLAGGKTANVLYASMKPGTVGIYEVHLELNSDLPTNLLTQLTIAQSYYVSNIITLPVLNVKDKQPTP